MAEEKLSSTGNKLEKTVDKHKAFFAIAGLGIGVIGFYIHLKSSNTSSNPNSPSAASQTNGLSQPPATDSVDTSMLANAMQQLSGQEQSDIQNLQQQLQQQNQSITNGLNQQQQTFSQALQQQNQSLLQQIQNLMSSIGNTGSNIGGNGSNGTSNPTNPVTNPVQTNPSPPTGNNPPPNIAPTVPTFWGQTWLQNNLDAWNNFISGGLVSGAKISPGWAALYVAQNHALPTLDQWNAFLNLNGLRNPNTGALSGNAGMPPSISDQQIIRQAFGYGLGFSNT